MKKFYCNGAKDFCSCEILCADCGFADWSGGEYKDDQVTRKQDYSKEILPSRPSTSTLDYERGPHQPKRESSTK